jgi:hypothetical protein
MKNKNAFCLIIVQPNKIWVEFLNTMTNDYDIFIVIDDSNYNISALQTIYYNITFIQINDEECKNNGYWDSSFMVSKNPSGWDKALYYFSKINTTYPYCWFCEDDVFFYSSQTLKRIDAIHPTTHLLCNETETNIEGYNREWHWHQAVPYFKLPWLKAMVCCCRLSQQLLEHIDTFVQQKTKLTFIECMFPTLAYQHNMTIATPQEFSNIHWRNDWTNFQLNPRYLYHPFKNIEDHTIIRRTGKLAKKSFFSFLNRFLK